MIRPPPRSTRPDTLFPYTTLFRSARALDDVVETRCSIALFEEYGPRGIKKRLAPHLHTIPGWRVAQFFVGEQVPVVGCRDAAVRVARGAGGAFPRQSGDMIQGRPAAAEQCSDQFRQRRVSSEARRVGNAGVSTCSSRWSPYH